MSHLAAQHNSNGKTVFDRALIPQRGILPRQYHSKPQRERKKNVVSMKRLQKEGAHGSDDYGKEKRSLIEQLHQNRGLDRPQCHF